jgi:hypothetical protein
MGNETYTVGEALIKSSVMEETNFGVGVEELQAPLPGTGMQCDFSQAFSGLPARTSTVVVATEVVSNSRPQKFSSHQCSPTLAQQRVKLLAPAPQSNPPSFSQTLVGNQAGRFLQGGGGKARPQLQGRGEVGRDACL